MCCMTSSWYGTLENSLTDWVLNNNRLKHELSYFKVATCIALVLLQGVEPFDCWQVPAPQQLQLGLCPELPDLPCHK
jgi:hypothetical protein